LGAAVTGAAAVTEVAGLATLAGLADLDMFGCGSVQTKQTF
jgi:hypothetical protein